MRPPRPGCGPILASGLGVAELARELGVSETTVRRWKGRQETADRSHRPHRRLTRFTPEEEEIVRELRTRLALSLDDILEVMRRCVRDDVSRSALHRCLQRLQLSAAPAGSQTPAHKPFDTTPFGYVHVDLKHLTRLQGRPAFVFVAIERTTRFVHVEVLPNRSAAAVASAFERFLQAFGHPVHTVLTDNGSEFTDRFGAARWASRAAGTGAHAFDQVCARHGVRHKLTRPYHPQTNGMVERFNRRISEALAAEPARADNAGRNRFASHEDRNRFLLAFVDSYNKTRLRCLGHKAPAEVLANLPEHNTKAGTQPPGLLRSALFC